MARLEIYLAGQRPRDPSSKTSKTSKRPRRPSWPSNRSSFGPKSSQDNPSHSAHGSKSLTVTAAVWNGNSCCCPRNRAIVCGSPRTVLNDDDGRRWRQGVNGASVETRNWSAGHATGVVESLLWLLPRPVVGVWTTSATSFSRLSVEVMLLLLTGHQTRHMLRSRLHSLYNTTSSRSRLD